MKNNIDIEAFSKSEIIKIKKQAGLDEILDKDIQNYRAWKKEQKKEQDKNGMKKVKQRLQEFEKYKVLKDYSIPLSLDTMSDFEYELCKRKWDIIYQNTPFF